MECLQPQGSFRESWRALQSIEGVVVATLTTSSLSGSSEEEHFDEVLRMMDSVHVKKKTCEFMKSSVEYLGHQIDALGLHSLQDKVEAVKKAPVPVSYRAEVLSGSFVLLWQVSAKPVSYSASPVSTASERSAVAWGPPRQEAFAELKKLLMLKDILYLL